jgi:hypothetical protein
MSELDEQIKNLQKDNNILIQIIIEKEKTIMSKNEQIIHYRELYNKANESEKELEKILEEQIIKNKELEKKLDLLQKANINFSNKDDKIIIDLNAVKENIMNFIFS